MQDAGCMMQDAGPWETVGAKHERASAGGKHPRASAGGKHESAWASGKHERFSSVRGQQICVAGWAQAGIAVQQVQQVSDGALTC